MYIVAGTYPPPSVGLGRKPAELRFESLDQAMQKLRDWVEADELDCATGGDGPMFVEYAIRIDPVPKSRHADAEASPNQQPNWPPLKLA